MITFANEISKIFFKKINMATNLRKTFFVLFFLCLSIYGLYAQNSNTRVLISTSAGEMVFTLYNATPKHRDNFIKLANAHFYDSLLFHRVIKNFMIQGGDPGSKNASPDAMLGMGDLGYRVPAEINDTIFHFKGSLAAARDGNPEKASSSCQFYIVQGKPLSDMELDMMEQRTGSKYNEKTRLKYKNIGGVPHLDRDYTVFGKMEWGFKVLDQLANTPTKNMDRPVEDQRMFVKVLTEKEFKKLIKERKASNKK
jgi:cyclophilin family peptidyl-prolyl cis-trans isomerase